MTVEEHPEKTESSPIRKPVRKIVYGTCIGKAICVIIYIGVAILQMRAVYAGLDAWLPDWFPLLGLLTLAIGGTPVLGAIVGVFGAVSVWQWSLMRAFVLFGGPYVIMILVTLVAILADYIADKSLRKITR
jgi:MFS family permease